MSEQFDLEEDGRPPRRRALLFGGAAVLAIGGLGLGTFWDPRADDTGRKHDGPARPGGTIAIAFDGAATPRFGLDPHNSSFAPHNRVIRSIYDNLTVLLPDRSVGPWLAESWEISPDRRTYDFKLRNGVSFHDGTPFDAASVVANFERLHDPANALTSRSSIGPFERARVLAPDRVQIRLAEPFTPFLRNLSMTKLAIVSPTAAAKHGRTFGQNPVGTGPFRFAGLTQGTEIRLDRNPDYRWQPSTARHAGPALLDGIVFRNVPEEATRVAVLQSRQVQASDLIPPQNLSAFENRDDFDLLQGELLESNYSLLLNVSKAPWNDEEIRRAVRLTLDIDAIVRVIYLGRFKRAWSPLSPSMFGSAERDLAGSWRPDPAQAARILDAKGWLRGADGIRRKDGAPLAISFIDSQGNREKRLDVVQLVRRQLLANGIDLHVNSVPSGAYVSKVAANEFDLAAGATFHADPDILRSAYTPGVRSAAAGNKVDDPELTRLLAAAAREPDGAGRIALYHQAERRIVEQTYAIPIYVLNYNLATVANLRGVALDAHGFPTFHDAWLDG